MTKIDKLFFLGSGASACAGIPTFSNFREKAEKISDNKFKKTLNFWKEEYKDYNIEEYYAAIEMLEMCNLPAEVTSQNIVELIATTIDKSLLKDYNKSSHHFLVNSHYPVITTNWDTLLEFYGNRLENMDIDYGGIEKYSESSKGWEDFSDKIFKLHGSLSWGICDNGKCNQIYYFDKRDYTSLKKGTAKCKKCNNQLKQYIVPPTFSKLVKIKKSEPGVAQLSDIWRKASGCLASCEHLYLIGYSFPETDAQMKIFISNALRKNENIKNITVVSTQKFGQQEVDFEDRYSSVLSRIKRRVKVVFNYDGFEKISDLI